MSLPSVFDQYGKAIDAEMRSVLAEVYSPLHSMMSYHLGWTDEYGQSVEGYRGKRVRPILCLLACEVSGGEYTKALPAAVAIELVHNFSLIQDDIQDDDTLRRGRPTVWSIWGKAQALNTVTAMHALTNLALSRPAGNGTPISKERRVQRLLNETILQMAEGQYWDIRHEESLEADIAEYLRVIKEKTAALISCSLEVGALIGTDDNHVIEALRMFGHDIGLAFQIRDDVLGIWGTVKKMGKAQAKDILRKKKTFPIIWALERADGETKAKLIEVFNKRVLDSNDVNTIKSILDSVGVRYYAENMTKDLRDRALAHLDGIPMTSRAGSDLRELAHFLADRAF